MTQKQLFTQWNETFRTLLLNRLTPDEEGRRFAMIILNALIKDAELAEILPTTSR